MSTPLAIPRYIEMVTDQAFERPMLWYRIVCDLTPGVVLNLPTENDGEPRVVRMVHRTAKRHHLIIPLARDLQPAEIEAIVKAMAAAAPDADFDVMTSETTVKAHDHVEIEPRVARQAAAMIAQAKRDHEDWVRQQTDAGWRYGVRFDKREKTDPLIRPWDQLPGRLSDQMALNKR